MSITGIPDNPMPNGDVAKADGLLPCPFCGGAAAFVPDPSYGGTRVICPDDNRCGVQPIADADLTVEDASAAIERWNTRLASQATDAKVEEGGAAALKQALWGLESAATLVARYGAQTGAHWVRLSGALIVARAALAALSTPSEGVDRG